MKPHLRISLIMLVFFLINSCASLKVKMPEDNTVVRSLEPTFSWEFGKEEDLSFELKLAEDAELSKNVKLFKIKDRQNFTLTIPYLKPGQKYFWSVRAVYYDKKSGGYTNSEWAYRDEKRKVPYSFTTSPEAEGDDQLEEGQKEEVKITGATENISRLTFDKNNEFAPAVSKDGKSVAFVSDRTKNFEIFVKDLDAGGAGEMQRTFSSSDQQNMHPFWLGDNNNLGFYTNRLDKENWHLFTTTKGKGLTLVSTSVSFTDPEWLFGSSSESENKLIFTSKTKNNPESTIWLYDNNSNRFTQLVPGLFPDIRKDQIVYCSDKSGNYDIWKMELKGNSIYRETQLTYHEGWDYDPVWSPDGTKIAFVSHRSGNSDIWVMDANGTDPMQVTFHPLADRRPQWVDNNSLVFQSNRELDKDGNPQWDIWLLNIDQ